MVPASFAESNRVLDRPSSMAEEECDPLCVHVSDQPHMVVSCWKLTQEELEEIKRTGRVWLLIAGSTMPPAMITAASPFSPQPSESV